MIEDNNVFYIKLEFGAIGDSVLILANDKEDAYETLNTYYDDPKIVCCLSLKEIVDFLNSLQSDNDFLLLEGEIKESRIMLNHQIELNTTKEELLKRYQNKSVFIINYQELLLMRENLVNEINNLSEDILLSENYPLK